MYGRIRAAISRTPVRCTRDPSSRRDYHRLLYAKDGLAARAAYEAFLKKWTPLCPRSHGRWKKPALDLLTCYTFPKAM